MLIQGVRAQPFAREIAIDNLSLTGGSYLLLMRMHTETS